MAKMLIEAGADVNALNRLGCTPLMEPIIAYKLEYISLLVEHGADPFIKVRYLWLYFTKTSGRYN